MQKGATTWNTTGVSELLDQRLRYSI